MRIPRLAPAAAVLLLGACSSINDPSVRRPALLSVGGNQPEVSVPAQAVVGQPFTVSITTWGGGCIAKGDEEVRVDGLTAIITPFDVDNRSGQMACTDDLRRYTHEARVTFNSMGTGTVRVVGRVERGAGSEVVTVTRTVPVTAPGAP